MLVVLLGLSQFIFEIGIVYISAWESSAEQRQDAHVVSVHRQRFLAVRIHLVHVLLLEVSVRQTGIDALQIPAGGISLQKILPCLHFLIDVRGIGRVHRNQTLIGRVFLWIHWGSYGCHRRTDRILQTRLLVLLRGRLLLLGL